MDDSTKSNASETATLINALSYLTKTDFNNLMGSGIVVKIEPITPGSNCPPSFMLAAEDMETIKGPMIDSIRHHLYLRKIVLTTEIGDIDHALNTMNK